MSEGGPMANGIEAIPKQQLSSPSPSQASVQPSEPHQPTPEQPDIRAWRKKFLLLSIFIGLFLSFLDTTIVSVALPTIANHFNDFDHATWVLTAYLLTYMAFSIIITRLSDIFGRRIIEISCFVFFLAFSLACGLSQSMVQLIIFRALQGIGGSGLFSMTIVIGINAATPKQRGLISSFIGITTALAGVLGPVLSGAITQNRSSSTWRWIFFLNLPVGGIALAMFIVSWPRDKSERRLSARAFASVDFLGGTLLLAASVLLIFGLQEGGAYVYPWNSGIVIACFVVAGVAFVAFIFWQEWLALHPDLIVQQVFPTQVMKHRVVAATTVITILTGYTYYTAIVYLPQRFQIVDRDNPLISGVKLMPMLCFAGIGSATAGTINVRRNLTSYTLVVSTAVQILGYGLMTTFGHEAYTPNSVYGFEVFLGLGFGLAIATVTIAVQVQIEEKWKATTQGAITQMRSLGGSLGLAAGVIIFNRALQSSSALSAALTPTQASALYRSPLVIAQLAPAQQEIVAGVFAGAFTQQMRVACCISAGSFLLSLLTWERNPPPAPAQQLQQQLQKRLHVAEMVDRKNEVPVEVV